MAKASDTPATRPASGAEGAEPEISKDKQARLEEVRARRAAENAARREANRAEVEEAKARARAEAEAKATARKEAAARAKAEAEEKARAEAAERARAKAEAEEKARQETEAKARAKAAAEEAARLVAAAQAEAEAEDRARAEAEAAAQEAARDAALRVPSPAAPPAVEAPRISATAAAPAPAAAAPAPAPAPPPPGAPPRLPSLARSILPSRPAGRALTPPAPPTPPQGGDAALAGFAMPPARPKRRHWGILVTFLVAVVLPFLLTGAYLWGVARDQFASTVAFSVRQEEIQSSLDILGGMTRLAGSSTSDTDILYEFIRSQDLVARIDGQLNLRAIWSRAWPGDPVFAFDPSGTIEDLQAHWLRMVKLSYDAATGIITVRVNTFDPAEAQKVAQTVFAESSRLINALSEEARADATRHAREERDRAFERLAAARQALTAFRLRTRIVDIGSDLQGQMGLLNTLQAQLAGALIEMDLLKETAQPTDPRIRQAERRIEVIEARIVAERAKFGEGGQGPGGEDYARIAAEFERLTVEREFAETTYTSALAAYEGAVSDAQRQSRYLAAHIRPTMAEQAMYPQRMMLFALAGFFLTVFWGVGVLVYYSVRDRR